MNRLLWLLALAACLGLLWLWLARPADMAVERPRPVVPVTVVRVELQDFQDEVSALGTLRAWESVDISSSVSQIVSSIGFEDGQRVARGDVLAVLKQDAEQASLRELQVSLLDARRELARLENLASKNQVAQTELDQSRSLEQITLHRIEEVRARIADRTIVAPFSGVLGLRQVSEGALVTPGQRLTTLDDVSRMRLEFNVPALLLGFLQVGQPVLAQSPAYKQAFVGTLAAIDSRVDPVARSVQARAILENPQFVLRPGLLMEVIIKGPLRQSLLVPEESLESRSLQHYLWQVQGDEAQRIPVEIGARVPGRVEIVQGLQPGDEVVRDGVARLRGDRVRIKRGES